MAAGRARVGPFALKRAGDDAADAIFAGQDLPRDAAVVIQLLRRHDGLVRRDLEDGIRRRVDDQIAGLHMLAAIVLDDLGAGIGQVAQDAPARLLAEGPQDLLREAVREGR